MIIDYDHNPALTEDKRLQSLKESVQMALNENDDDHRGLRALLDKANAAIDSAGDKFVDINDAKVVLDTAAPSGTDHDLYQAIVSLGWQNDVIV